MTNTLERPGEFDALPKLRPDEPYFVLLGRDRLAPGLVQQWADSNRHKAMQEFNASEKTTADEAVRDRELRQSTDAEQLSWDMKGYKQGQEYLVESGQLPLTGYTGHVPVESQRKKDAVQAAKSRAISAVHNAISCLSDLTAACKDLGMADAAEVAEALTAHLRGNAEVLTAIAPYLFEIVNAEA